MPTTPIRNERLTAELDGDFVLFLIGLRINEPHKVAQWLPTLKAMPGMLAELRRQPALGLLHADMWLGRTTLMTQYWRSMDQLLHYAHAKDAEHLPAWRQFNRKVGTGGA